MKILLTGGGTGGHITPLLAVAHELKQHRPGVQVIYVGEHGGKFATLVKNNPDIDEIHTVFAGKFRRYHGESWTARLLDVKTNLLNLRDLFYFLIGTCQSVVLIKRLSPDATLLKGGFVGVPVGLASALWRKPFVTHDSDAMPGLANRIVSRWASCHATAMPPENYPNYLKDKVAQVGVLVSGNHKEVTKTQQTTYKIKLGIPDNARLLLVTGGSGGAAKINAAIRTILPQLLADYEDLYVVHQVGKGKAGVYEGYTHPHLIIKELLVPMYEFTGASDVVVTRAGANTIAELGVQGKACIVIPNPLLTGGHQTKNAESLEQQGAIVVVKESTLSREPSELDKAIRQLLQSESTRHALSEKLHSITIPDASEKLTEILLQVADS